MTSREELFKKHGWEIECESPLEIRKYENGSRATKEAALMVEACLDEEERSERVELEKRLLVVDPKTLTQHEADVLIAYYRRMACLIEEKHHLS